MRLALAVLAFVANAACGGPVGPSSMEFVDITPAQPRIGDVITINFKLLDSRGLPMAGQEVAFSLQSPNAAVTLSPATGTSQKGSGIAQTQLQVNGRVTSLIVVAKAGGKTVISPAITVAGSVPNGRQLTFQCGPTAGVASGGRHAIGAYDATRGLIAGVKLECTAHLADRNGDGVAGALVSFMTEAGAIGPTEVSMTDVVGNATVLFKTSLPLPLDVKPGRFDWAPLNDLTHTGTLVAPLWMEPFAWVGDPVAFPRPPPILLPVEPSRTDPIRKKADASNPNNPRDNLVTIIAVTAGEEGFSDDNNNGTHDENEAFDDLTEPFVDSDDDGTWGAGEKFIDANGLHSWDGKNGVWDANTLIWTSERILWTGIPHALDASSSKPLIKQIDPASIALTCPGTGLCNAAGPPVWVTAILSDPWYNTIAQNGDGDGCTIDVVEKSPIQTTPHLVNQGPKFTYPAGDVISFLIKDARDPLAKPSEQIPRRSPPISFTQPVTCTFTSSPRDGQIARITLGAIGGTIE